MSKMNEIAEKLNDIMNYSRIAKKQYDILYTLDVNGERDSNKYRETLNNLKMLVEAERRYYNRLDEEECTILSERLSNIQDGIMDTLTEANDLDKYEEYINLIERVDNRLEGRLDYLNGFDEGSPSYKGIPLYLPAVSMEDLGVQYGSILDLCLEFMLFILLENVTDMSRKNKLTYKYDSGFVDSYEEMNLLHYDFFIPTSEYDFYRKFINEKKNDLMFKQVMEDYYNSSVLLSVNEVANYEYNATGDKDEYETLYIARIHMINNYYALLNEEELQAIFDSMYDLSVKTDSEGLKALCSLVNANSLKLKNEKENVKSLKK